ncbi:MAG: hypothetical protein L6E13_11155 [Firmicutes bacterium]|nr:hypothetical protein [Bacillota bacterium]
MSELKCIKVPVVLGLGETQHLICTEIPLKPPAFEIKDVVKRVDVTQCCVGGVVKDEVKERCIAKVIIDAVLRKNINFKTHEGNRDHQDHHGNHTGDGRKDPDVQGALETKMLCGDLRHCFVEIPFCTLVEVALDIPFSKCDKLDVRDLFCQLEEAEVVAQCEEEYRDDHGRIEKIIEKDVVRVVVKVERLEQFKVAKMGECHFSTHC